MSENPGRPLTARNEDALLQHYYVFKEFLAPQIDLNVASNPSRARDKLMRLSPTQFFELSTDVFDELRRRQDERRRGPEVPRSLMPTKDFHPKRNQARQKLATLPADRFKQLATDVYFESERRVPRLGGGGGGGGGMDRSASPALSNAGSYRGPPRGPPPGMRGPPPPGGFRGPPPPNRGPADRNQQFPARSSSNDYGRPLPKASQSNTIVPNKSTVVEDDDTDDDDAAGLASVISGGSNNRARDIDPAQVQAYESQIAELQSKVASLESNVRNRDDEIQKLETAGQERDAEMTLERDDWKNVQAEMERQITELEGSRSAHTDELDRTHQSHAQREAGLREEMEQTVTEMQAKIDSLNAENSLLRLQGGSGPSAGDEELEQKCEALKKELADQQRVTEEVRENATHFLQEMRNLSQQSEAAFEKEEQLRGQIATLEAEVEEWKARYAKTKTELRTLKASSIGLPLQNMASDVLAARQNLLSRDGLVSDVDVTGFQMSIDELLQTARQNSSSATLDKMKVVVSHVQQITSNVKDDYTGLPSPAESPNPMSPQLNGGRSTAGTLKARVARNATGLITATRNYVSSDGLSPVSLVDAAAANLTAAVIDYVKTVGIKASSSNDLSHDTEFDDEGYETLSSTVHVPQPSTRAQETKPAMGNGWFSRLKGSFDSSYSHELDPSSLRDDDDSDYNSFR
ncbi:hypothetical protein K461DRAFT_294704 [Myriangium duriaei CBS 260.36]|uniref:GIT Spa2 homology (SHD) domain-containing protein n=1 Tax=Myriangium duriaei CBS 260.36 TaxID=1168546 RepID=A0A9P4IZK4_9PEZI|nr:hypothetical protein K461DRAFT_294704 [Myriangium duriaei CBS 260.36]